MNTSAQISPPPTFRDMLAEVVTLIAFVPAYGPPAVFLLGPWLVLVLVLGGPLAWLFALVVVAFVVAICVVDMGAPSSRLVPRTLSGEGAQRKAVALRSNSSSAQ